MEIFFLSKPCIVGICNFIPCSSASNHINHPNCYSAYRRGTVISAVLSWLPMSSDCAFIPGGMLRVQSLHLPRKGLGPAFSVVISVLQNRAACKNIRLDASGTIGGERR